PKLVSQNPDVAYSTIKYGLWWALSLGACLGGNGSLVGASANVVAAGVARKSGTPITFLEFMKYGVIVTFESMVLSSFYLWFFYLN
ncbi:MAG: hypothetical protein ACQERZ_09525, partial [Fusobacteriota bacterium]